VAPLRRPLSRGAARAPDVHAKRARAAIAVGTALVLAAAVQGARGQMQSFPFACYPTFQWIPGREMPDARWVVTRASGAVEVVPDTCILHTHRDQETWGRVWRLTGALDGNVDRPRLEAMARAEVAPRRGDRVRVERVYCAIDPAAWGKPPARVDFLFEWTE
jgi:hypothetical protein